ncbi:MAG TPA: potassium-transporting ATPase subunit KdpA [Actinobacteria bacterium]|jgi:K+-transporting ATPase ATPase A chain|nr:potassium-transporting ATPase subunit KdpA [Actinomycetota bacterium]
MNASGWEQLLFIAVVTAVLAPLLGRYLAATFRGAGAIATGAPATSASATSASATSASATSASATSASATGASRTRAPGDRVFLPVERLVYRALRIDPDSSWTWRAYALAVLAFGLVSTLLLYLILRLQGVLPLNPTHAPGMSSLLSFNTAASFITGTNWQAYEGETAASYLAQMAGLVVAQFTAGAIGLAVALAVVRGIAGTARTIGNFWVDLTRSLVRVYIPLSVIGALVLVSQGAVQNFSGFRAAATLAGGTQQIPGGPVTSMEVIKLLGTNGGSFYGAGGAHPFENPTGFTNMFDLLLVIVLPFAIAIMFGRLIGRPRQGYAIVAVMAIIFIGHTVVSMQAEVHGNQLLPASVSQAASTGNPGGYMEGKEMRFGASGSALMTVGTMGTTAGATDSALDSYTPIGGAGAFVGILLGEVSPGGDGGGLYSILVFSLLAVFIAGLMVGRTPEFLGKKIRAPQMKLVVAYVLTIPVVVLVFGSMSLVLGAGKSSILNPGFHGLSEITYAYASVANNNGSAFAGLAANTTWYDTTLGLVMLVGRFAPIVLALAIAGSLAGARVHARTRATLDTTGPTFVVFLLGVIVIVGGLIYFPMLILGPIGERIVG